MADSVADILEKRAQDVPDFVPLVDETGVGLSYRDWYRRSESAALALRARDLRVGDRVALVMGNGTWIDFAVGYSAVIAAGGVAVPVSVDLGATALRSCLTSASASTTIVAEEARHVVEGLTPQVMTLAELESDRSGDSPEALRASRGEVSHVLFTAGSTGKPKIVLVTHERVAECWHAPDVTASEPAYVVHAFPIGSNAALALLLRTIGQPGGVLVTMKEFSPERFISLVERYRATVAFLSPVMGRSLGKKALPADERLASLRTVSFSGAPLPETTVAAVRSAAPHADVLNVYTSTEVWPASTATVCDGGGPTSLGSPNRYSEVQIRTVDGGVAAPGQVGTVHLFSRSGDEPWDTTGTGDIGYVDANGALHLIGRADDLVLAHGGVVSPISIEETLRGHESVIDAAVVILRRNDAEPLLVAVVVPDGTGAVDQQGLQQFIRGELGASSTPHLVIVLPEIPRTALGKLDRKRLRHDISRYLARSSFPQSVRETDPRFLRLCQEVLGVTTAGDHDYLVNLGADSLGIIEVTEAIAQQLGVELELAFVAASTLADISGAISCAAPSAAQSSLREDVG